MSEFFTSSHSGASGECVEVALPTSSHHGAAVRDSKHPDLGHLPVGAGEWGAFLRALNQA